MLVKLFRAMTYPYVHFSPTTPEQVLALDCQPSTKAGIAGLPNEIVAATSYDYVRTVQRAILSIKYKRDVSMVEPVAELLFRAIRHELKPGMVLCPVPLHWSRYLDRGFNQASGIAKVLSKHTKLPVEHLLRRTRNTGRQAWRSREDRLHAMDNAFVAKRMRTVPRHVVLIDDVVTTGATLHACAKALDDVGVRHIDAWVVARS